MNVTTSSKSMRGEQRLPSQPPRQPYSESRTDSAPLEGIRLRFPSAQTSAIARVKTEIVRLGTDGGREGFELAKRLFEAAPELRTA